MGPVFSNQVDDFALASPDENIAKEIYKIIGDRIKFPSEKSPPFEYLGLMNDYNGVKVEQTSTNIAIHAKDYITRVLTSHGWDKPSSPTDDRNPKKPPFSPDMLPNMYKQEGDLEDTPGHAKREDKFGFKYRSILGELMFAYVTCRPDIGYHVTTLSKFSTAPADVHYLALKSVVRYLRSTIDWGIIYDRGYTESTLPKTTRAYIDPPDDLPEFPVAEYKTQLVGYVDAAHANDLRKRRSTTGYAFMINNGIVSYRSKTQSVTATSSTEAEFLAAVTAAKQAKYLRAVMKDLGFVQEGPTPLYEDNESAINIVNHRVPTERSRHIDIQHFAIQDWAEAGDIIMRHIPGIINPPDDLTKPLGWILHSRHARRIMGHYHPIIKY